MADDQKPTEDSGSIEEEISISGAASAPTKGDAETSDSDPDDVNRIKTNVAKLGDIVGPGATEDEFLDRLLQTPSEQLIPWEICHLPSKGLYYDWTDGEVKVRAMGQTAEKILSTSRLAQSGQSIDYLFRECCQFPNGFDPVNLLLGDRIFLLYFLRGITHGNIYEFAFTCPNPECEQVSTHSYDLNELTQTIVWAEDGLGAEPFKVTLPYLSEAADRSVWVSVRFLRAYDANDLLAKRKAKKKLTARPGGVRTKQRQSSGRGGSLASSIQQQRQQNQSLDETLTDNLEKVIVEVMGSNDPFKVRQFVNRMHASDTATVREWLREHTPGIDNTVILTCPECSNEWTVELPITESFFRPTKS